MRGEIKYGGHTTPDRYFIEGREVTRAQWDEAFPSRFDELMEGAPAAPSLTGWPMWSDALAVHPEQIPEAMANDRARGIASEYHPEDGRMKLMDRGQRRDVMRSLGMHDRNGGYLD